MKTNYRNLIFGILAITFPGISAICRAEPFKNGETVCFLGDSITHGRQYHGMIYAYYLTRFPDRKIRFVNAGIAGDTAGGAFGRLEEDVLSKSPTTVVVMLGMNDVGRSNYVANPTEKQLAARKSSLDRYRTNMDKLLDRISSESEAKIILLTPSPYDQTCVNDKQNNQPGCNDGLAKCGVIVRELAAKHDAEVFDLHAPMTAFNLEMQKKLPSYTLIGPDRIHPGFPGNLMMARLFLKAQGVPDLVSLVEINAETVQVIETKNALVENLRNDTGTLTFTVQEKALPWPIENQARSILEFIPLEKELNREILRIKHLAKGTYALKIDGEEIARHTASDWEKGINLALNPATPQAKQAVEVAKINERRRTAEVRLRGYACVRWFLGHRSVDADDLAAVATYLKSNEGESGYYLNKVPGYLEEWKNREKVEALVFDLEKKARQVAVPVAHEYELHQPTE